MRSAMHAASQLPGRGAPLLWILPLYLHINQKSNDDDDDGLLQGFSVNTPRM